MTVCKRTILSLSIPLLAGLTACAPDLFPDLPDDDTCYNRVQEIIQITNETAINTPELQMQLNPEPYLNILCARGKLRKASVSRQKSSWPDSKSSQEPLPNSSSSREPTPPQDSGTTRDATSPSAPFTSGAKTRRRFSPCSAEFTDGEKITGKSIFRN